MTVRGAGSAALIALIMGASPALAHPPPFGIHGFSGGLLHPLFVPAHAMALVALGLLLAQQSQWGQGVVFAILNALAAGLGMMMLGVVPRFAHEAVLALAGTAGLLTAMARPLPAVFGCVVSGAAAFAIALDSPPEVISVSEANLMLLGTGCGVMFWLLLIAVGASRATRVWARVAVRVLGSWIAASAILVLALRLGR